MKKTKLMLGDNITSLQKLPDNSIDSVVTDPPYGLSFMNKKWDYDVPSVEFWKEVYRVLKPGGHILSFGGTRTYHRMVVNIEDVGFEIRDQIMWLYGSGFPKSHNIGKAVDKLEGNEREVVGKIRPNGGGGVLLNGRSDSDAGMFSGKNKDVDKTKGSSPYEGWGTALKPANEPICVARKPLSEKSVAENVLKWGTGGINIDGCRIGTEGATKRDRPSNNEHNPIGDGGWRVGHKVEQVDGGRFPANIILDETAAELLDQQSGISDYTKKKDGKPGGKTFGGSDMKATEGYWPKDKGGASRFFYIPKVSKKERNMGLDAFEEKVIEGRDGGQDERNVAYKARPSARANTHPTVKPVQLMTYLCRLITPENGIILDPYMGSGSTGIAALLEGFRFCGMEMDKDYFKIAESRIENYESYREFLEKKKK